MSKAAVLGRRKRPLSLRAREELNGYAFILPWLIGLIALFGVPLIMSVVFALNEVKIIGTGGYTLEFAGIENFVHALTKDAYYPKYLAESLLNLLYNVPVIIVFSFFVAMLLKNKFRGSAAVNAIFFLPIILSSGLFLQMQTNFGQDTTTTLDAAMSSAANLSALKSVNMEKYLLEMGLSEDFISIITGPIDRIYTVISSSGVQIFIFLAGLKSISPSLYEAARVEGGNGWEMFWKITFPMVTPLLLVNLVYSIVDTFTSVGNSVMDYAYKQAFTEMNFGLSNAMCWIYLAILGVCIAVVAGIMSKRIFYYT
ncbi:MAG: sugar ABC transporter permease [Clostridia bacterium]|nr:sugar ABC transporter permease [Clostridia bacterium]